MSEPIREHKKKIYKRFIQQLNLGVECCRSPIISVLTIPSVAAVGMVAELGENSTHSHEASKGKA
ncbi:hypothetical protein F2Q68_00008836 [Brassica cretica]|uniref:Uncharacterized protein n=1 Tax=Brassica cretica TaxID=69181 RepID=A0A8S9L2M1_BRACR|nr:hypothetical protein F2Q68_00008836 [Brassica cretica]